MSSVTPIETKYRGCLFRSRLEARWAVFFDAVDIEWEYEAEGFDVNGRWYLPDFWLPTQQTFIEIKPKDVPREALDLARRFRDSGRRIIILAGSPFVGRYTVRHCWPSLDRPGQCLRPYGDLCYCTNGEGCKWHLPWDGTWLGLEGLDRSELLKCRRCDGFGCVEESTLVGTAVGEIGLHVCGNHDRVPLPFQPEAYEIATSYRF